jgi:hypothetical protein
VLHDEWYAGLHRGRVELRGPDGRTPYALGARRMIAIAA